MQKLIISLFGGVVFAVIAGALSLSPQPINQPAGAASAETEASPHLELSCIRIGDTTYFQFTDLNQGYNVERVVPVNMVGFRNTERDPQNRIYFYGGYHHGYLAILPEVSIGMTSLQAVHHCVSNAADYSGS